MPDITQALEERAVSYDQSGPSAQHTAQLLRQAKAEIEWLRNDLKRAQKQLRDYEYSGNSRGTKNRRCRLCKASPSIIPDCRTARPSPCCGA